MCTGKKKSKLNSKTKLFGYSRSSKTELDIPKTNKTNLQTSNRQKKFEKDKVDKHLVANTPILRVVFDRRNRTFHYRCQEMYVDKDFVKNEDRLWIALKSDIDQ